jgi:hypothetical protein
VEIKTINMKVADIVSNLNGLLEDTEEILVIRLNKNQTAILSSTLSDPNIIYLLDKVKFQLLCESSGKAKLKHKEYN